MSLTRDLGIVDSISKAQRVITTVHAHIHEGEVFQAKQEFAAIADTASAYMLLSVAAGTYPHLINRLINASGSPCLLELFEAPTVSAAGTAVALFNRNRNADDDTSGVTATHTPTITDEGTRFDFNHMRTTAKQAGGGSTEAEPEWMLKPDTLYLFKATNNSGAAADIAFDLFWYENL